MLFSEDIYSLEYELKKVKDKVFTSLTPLCKHCEKQSVANVNMRAMMNVKWKCT